MATWQYWLLIGLIVLAAYASERRYDQLIDRLDSIRDLLDEE